MEFRLFILTNYVKEFRHPVAMFSQADIGTPELPVVAWRNKESDIEMAKLHDSDMRGHDQHKRLFVFVAFYVPGPPLLLS